MEQWKGIDGYEGLYQISNVGRVKSLGRYKKSPQGKLTYWVDEKIRAVLDGTNGYKMITLNKDGTKKSHMIHRLVAEHFVNNPNGLPEVNHKDENKHNNRADNLEWCDRIYNVNYGAAREKQKANTDYSWIVDRCSIPVVQMDLGGNFINRFKGISEAARRNGCRAQEIVSCCKGRRHKHAGFRWMYAGDYEAKTDKLINDIRELVK